MKHDFTVKLAFALCVTLFTCAEGNSQSDSTIVHNTKWEVEKIAPGIKLKHFRFENSLFDSNQDVNILEIELRRKNRLDVAAEPVRLKPTSEFGICRGALAALNGTFFDMENGGSMDYVRVDGETVNESRISAQSGRSLHQKAAIVVSGNEIAIEAWDGTHDWESRLDGEDVMVTGPLLISEGQRAELGTDSQYTLRHPRSAIATMKGKLLLVTVDGRTDLAAGMSLYELASFLKWIGADEGINLDGGGSTTLWIEGSPGTGIVNHPSDQAGERPVANVLLINEKSYKNRK